MFVTYTNYIVYTIKTTSVMIQNYVYCCVNSTNYIIYTNYINYAL